MKPKRKLYIHLNGRIPFPVNQEFFGQTFVIGNHTACSRSERGRIENIVAYRKSVHAPPLLEEPSNRMAAARLTRKKFNANLLHDYESALDELSQRLVRKIEKGALPIIISHYPISREIDFLIEVKERLRAVGLDRRALFVAYLHTQFDIYRNGDGNGVSQFVKKINEHCDLVVAVTNAIKKEFEELSEKILGKPVDGEKVRLIRNGIDPLTYTVYDEELVAECRSELGLAKDLRALFGYVGRLDRIKGSDLLVKIIDYFDKSKRPEDNEVGFLIATSHVIRPDTGSSYFMELFKMERLIAEDRLKLVLDISKFVRRDERYREIVKKLMSSFAPQKFAELERQKIYGGMTVFPVQAISDAVIHPARSEGLPLAILEAIFSGAFVLGSTAGGLPETVPATAGLLLPHNLNNVSEYVNIMTHLDGNGRRRAPTDLEEFTDRTMFRKLEDAVSDALWKKSGG